MKYAVAVALGVFFGICAIGFIANTEDSAVAEKCDYAGKVKLDHRVYECFRAQPTQPTQPTPSGAANG